jgi:glutaconate CoA-transferase, subunit B
MSEATYSLTELLCSVAARLIENGQSVFVGTGLPMIATMLAQRTHAPDVLVVFEAGGVGPEIPSLPISVGDARTFHRALAATSMHDVMSAAQAGYIDTAFLGGAEIDAYGNLNTTVIGDWERPTVRLPGSGGANDLGSLCWQTVTIMRAQSRRTFVEKLDFVTTPGWLGGAGERERQGLPAGGGPYRVITQLGVYGFEEESKRLMLVSLHPGVSAAEVEANSGFEIIIPDGVTVTRPPTAEEQRILREIDPTGMVIGKG